MKCIRRPLDENKLKNFSSLPAFLARIYAARDIQDLSELSYDFSYLRNFEMLKGIDAATNAIADGIMRQKRFLIVGDFDADGATATAVAVKGLKLLGATQVDFIVPNRFEYGYGLTPEIVDVAALRKPDILITVDNGIASVAGVAHANSLGIPVVITDHHLPGPHLPAALAIVNPNQPGCPFPCKNTAGVGVMFYVLCAVRAELRKRHLLETIPPLVSLLDLVALGTVADVVPLDHNNRILVQQGLMRIRKGLACPGIQALIEVSRRDAATLNSQDLGFSLGPRLNAAGRLEDMSIGIACLLSDNIHTARRLAEQLHDLNETRKQIEDEMKIQAKNFIEQWAVRAETLPRGLALYDEAWHAGVVGILAARIKEAYHRPVICFAKASETELKGSARSMPGVHMRDVLDQMASQHPELIHKFGGHAMAAGVSIHPNQYAKFCQIFAETVSLYWKEEDCHGVLWSDGALLPDELNKETARLLQAAGPFGSQFPEPLFEGQFFIEQARVVGEKHLKWVLRPEGSAETIDGIYFNAPPFAQEWIGQSVQLAYRLGLNYFRGEERLQVQVEKGNIL